VRIRSAAAAIVSTGADESFFRGVEPGAKSQPHRRRLAHVRPSLGRYGKVEIALAELCGVETRALVQAVKRNATRFPPDFMFRLEAKEAARLRSQFVISKVRGGRRHAPHVFTEQGVAMLSSVLKSPRAVQANIQIMRAFVRLRELMVTHAALMRKLNAMERKYDGRFKVVFEAIRELMAPRMPSPRRSIGFRP